jgi:hypothetical protein
MFCAGLRIAWHPGTRTTLPQLGDWSIELRRTCLPGPDAPPRSAFAPERDQLHERECQLAVLAAGLQVRRQRR